MTSWRHLSFAGQTQSHQQSICNEAAEQVWDDQEVGLCFLLGGERHHGLCKQLLGGSGMMHEEEDSVCDTPRPCIILTSLPPPLMFYPAALLCIPRRPLPLHGDGIHAGWGPGEPDEQLRCTREMGSLLHGWGCAGPGRDPFHGLHSQVNWKPGLLSRNTIAA